MHRARTFFLRIAAGVALVAAACPPAAGLASSVRGIHPTVRSPVGLKPGPSPAPSPRPVPSPPALATIARADVLKRVDATEVMTHAHLDDYSSDRLIFSELDDRVRFLERNPPREGALDYGHSIQSYDFYVGVRVNAPVKRARDVLTDYRIYKKLIPYVDEMEFNPRSRILSVQGGIWRFKIRSRIRFEERSDRWLRFQIVGGHFRGMQGELILEPVASENGSATRVWLRGQSISRLFPPGWVIEQGAQVVFTFTATRLRSFIESGKTVDSEVPELPAKPMGAPGPVLPSVPRIPLVLNPAKSPESAVHSSSEHPFQEEEEKKNVTPASEPSGSPVPRPRRSL